MVFRGETQLKSPNIKFGASRVCNLWTTSNIVREEESALAYTQHNNTQQLYCCKAEGTPGAGRIVAVTETKVQHLARRLVVLTVP